CAVHRDGQRFTLSKEASVISYGSESDDILLTARRHPDSPPTDQVLVHVPTDSANLVETGQWDTLGMRGTRSLGFLLDTEGDVSQIMEATGSEVLAHTMVPVTHLTWAGVWLGIAENAATKARSYVRAQARKDPEVTPPSATELAQLYMQLETCRAAVDSASERFGQHEADGAGATDALQTVQMNNLKLMLSTHVVSIVQSALAVCGISGYRNDSPYSLGRQIRDSLSAPIMIHNDRIVAHNASLLSLLKGK
ncbi:MAG TPA: acyl-CoA dehydrogenase, partial [Acidimicrobiaceae bacterium]|nr:acyl-CoA dehydrogenase [Acidimicrobiaceae bacterium]